MQSLGFLHRWRTFRVHPTTLVRDHTPETRGTCLIKPNNFPGNVVKSFSTSFSHFIPGSTLSTGSSISKIVDKHRTFFNRKPTSITDKSMGYFVIGVSGVTCGGKTTLTKLLLRKFPWALVIHQDHYFYDDDYPNHVRVPEAENHVNYEILEALDMKKMYKDVQAILDAPPEFRTPSPVKEESIGVGDKAETPNFDETFLQQIPDINYDVSKYTKVPILIIEGFTIFASQYLFDKCHARFFCSLDKETCRQRRALRQYFPPDTPSFFAKVVWPEYLKHYNDYIHKREGVTEFDGNTLIDDIWKSSVQIITCRIEEKLQANNVDAVTQLKT